MSLAYAIARAAPFYNLQQSTNAILNGEDPFFQNLGGKNDIPATGGLPSLDQLLNHGGASSIDPLFTRPAQVAEQPMPGITGADVAKVAATAGPKVLFTPPAYSNPYAGIHFAGHTGASMLDTLAHNEYNNSNFQHFAAPDGSKLPFVGPNYQKYGDMPGYWYDPFTDRYKTNINKLVDTMDSQGAVTNAAKLAQKFGLVPKTPSTMDTLLNGLLGAGTSGLGGYLSKALFGGKTDSGGGGSILDSIFGSLKSGNSGLGGGDLFGPSASSPDFASIFGDTPVVDTSTDIGSSLTDGINIMDLYS